MVYLVTLARGKSRTRWLMKAWLMLFAICNVQMTICLGQTSSNLNKNNPKAEYESIKTAMQQLYESGALRSQISGKDYDLYNCANGYEFTGPAGTKPGPLIQLSTLALQVVVWRNDLPKIGYPKNVWGPAVSEFENRQFGLLLREAGQPESEKTPSEENYSATTIRLANLLNNYRNNGNPTLPHAVSEGGCGAGDFAVEVSTEPSNGRAFFIPVFFHELCRAQKLDPDDTVQCDRWQEALDGELTYVAGDYYYVARWPDGTVRRGRLGFTHLQEGQKIVLRER